MSLTKKRIKNVFNASLENIRNNKQPNVSGLMLKAGYKKYAAKSLTITKSKTWQELLNGIDNTMLTSNLQEIANDRDDQGHLKDKDAVIKAVKELATLKDLYPATKSKVIGLFDKISSLE